jgi:hypothetical protein
LELVDELLEAYERARGSIKKHYPGALTAGLTGPAGEYELRSFIEDFGRTFTGSLRCRDSFCEAQVFVGHPPQAVREDMEAYARTYPQCRALHERLIEAGSVLSCSESPTTGMDRLLDMVKLVVEEMRR